ncbi:hypothetical protein Tco_1001470 [Tanacetum coccineum]
MNKQKVETKKSKDVSDSINETIEYDRETDLVNSNEIKDNGVILNETMVEEDTNNNCHEEIDVDEGSNSKRKEDVECDQV